MLKLKFDKDLLSSLLPSLVALMLIWIPYSIEHIFDLSFASFGILPRSFKGLIGIFTSPFLHGDLVHIGNNSLPLAVLIGYLFTFYRELAYKVIFWSILMTGVWVWVSARQSYHLGASGLIYALSAFLFFSGIVRKNLTLMAVSLTIAFLYGSFIWGIFPLEQKVSWESHLWGAISGTILAVYFRSIGEQKTYFAWQMLSEEEYLKDNINKYGPYYWDPVKQAEYLKEQEQVHDTTDQSLAIVYHYVPNNASELPIKKATEEGSLL